MKLKELYTDASKWTQYSLARRVDGSPCYPENPNAVCFCLMGGVEKCYPYEKWAEVRGLLIEHLGVRTISMWNDNALRSFDEVKDLVTTLDI